MPKIQDAFKTITIELPSYKESRLVVKTKAKVEDLLEAEKCETETETAILLSSKMIFKWNFQDKNGKDLPVSTEHLKQLPAEDLEFLMDKITPYLQKKTPSGKTKS